MSHLARVIIGLLGWLFSLAFTFLIIGGIAATALFSHYSKDLPDYSQLSVYDPPNITRLYSGDGKLLAEYATEKRVFVPLTAIPKKVIQGFLSAEDKNFYAHGGVDLTGIARAIRNNIVNYGQGKSLVGGSTITQQVVKNFLLTSEKSIGRKVREAILATRISRVFSKDKILELYLNEIYLGLGSYGVAAAAQNYFNKSLEELTIEEIALLAAQPKGPSLYNPKRNYDAALERRNWVLERIAEDGHLPLEELEKSKKEPITLRSRDAADVTHADFFAEEVRRTLADMYGSNVLYEGGLVVKTTLDPALQKAADDALRAALIAYDRRRGYRGVMGHLSTTEDWKPKLAALTQSNAYQMLAGQRLAVVTALSTKQAQLSFEDGTQGILPQALLSWTRRVIADGQLGPAVNKPADILKLGDVVLVGPISDEQKKQLPAAEQAKSWDLAQVPEVSGAMVAIDPHTGRVLAMSGGYAYGGSEFNRATQAKRQPGSAFKPFVYLAGLENGFTPSTIIMDAPVELSQGAGMPTWKPQNYHNDYLGPTTMRVGLEKSRNTMTVRMAQIIGIDKATEIGTRFGIYDTTRREFSIVLGSAETTLLRLTNAYSSLASGGKKNTPSLIERIDDRHGKTIYRRDSRECLLCKVESLESLATLDKSVPPPMPEDNREQLADPRLVYQLTSMLHGVTVRGTASRAGTQLQRILAGKTGTTNDSKDTWFIGYSPDLVVGVFVGYDKPRTMGKRETGSSVALPAFIDFMKVALEGKPNQPFRVPRGIRLARTDLYSGMPPSGFGDEKIIEEAYVTGGPIFVPGNGIDPKTIGTESDANILYPSLTSPAEIQKNPAPPVFGTGSLY